MLMQSSRVNKGGKDFATELRQHLITIGNKKEDEVVLLVQMDQSQM